MRRERFEELVAKAIDDLPEEFLGALENVDVVVQDSPNRRQSARVGRGTTLLALHLFRLQNTLTIRLEHRPDIIDESTHVDPEVTRRLNFLRENRVSLDAPSFRFYTPIVEKERRYRIYFTMMETENIHPDFVERLNSYDEVLVPTPWNARVFRDGGTKVPVHVVPLGVQPAHLPAQTRNDPSSV